MFLYKHTGGLNTLGKADVSFVEMKGAPDLLFPERLTRPSKTTLFSPLSHQGWFPSDIASMFWPSFHSTLL